LGELEAEFVKLSTRSHQKKHLQDKLEDVKNKFLRLLEDIPDKDLERKQIDETWTIKEELVHIIQVVEVIPSGIERASQGHQRSWLGFIPASLRSSVNGRIIIPQKAKNETRETIARAYQEAHKILISKLETLKDDDWKKGMPYPRKYRTVAQMAYRPVGHFEEHEVHIHRLLGMERERE